MWFLFWSTILILKSWYVKISSENQVTCYGWAQICVFFISLFIENKSLNYTFPTLTFNLKENTSTSHTYLDKQNNFGYCFQFGVLGCGKFAQVWAQTCVLYVLNQKKQKHIFELIFGLMTVQTLTNLNCIYTYHFSTHVVSLGMFCPSRIQKESINSPFWTQGCHHNLGIILHVDVSFFI